MPFDADKVFYALKVCVIGPIPPPAGGMANQTAELCRLLALEQAQVRLVATNAAYRPTFIGNVRGLRALFRLIPYLIQLRTALKHSDVAHLMANSGWSWHLYAVPAIWIAYWTNTPLVLNYRGGHAEHFFNTSWKWVAPSLQRTTACIVPSVFLSRVFSKRQIDTQVIPNTLNNDLFYPPKVPRAFKQTSNNVRGPIIVITRNLEQIYGIDLAINALPHLLKHYPGTRMIIAGTGPEEDSLRSLAKSLNIDAHVEFCGRLSRQEVAELYRDADLMLNPTRVDNSPNSIIEALACGLPVVSTRAGGIPDLVTHGQTAYLVEPESSLALADASIEVLASTNLQTTLRSQGLEASKRFQWARIKTDLAHVYKQAQGNFE